MTPERWGKIKEIFDSVQDKPEQERGVLVAEACVGDDLLQHEVLDLLSAARRPSLESPVAGVLQVIPPALIAGCMLGRYRVDEKLGQGGMGTVYRAFDIQLRRPVALKVLAPEHGMDPERRERLLREARAASALSHPNIVAIHEVGADRGAEFIAMELVDGRPLSRLLPAEGLPLEQALDYAAQIAAGLAKAHACGIIHRDLKPGNIMVTDDGLVKLLDFGLARRLPAGDTSDARLTTDGEILGTPAYMSPEQADGRDADERSDIFSFGAVLYEMLTGCRPFPGDSAAAILAAVLRDDPAGLAGIPPELDRLVRRCLRKDPAQRPQHIDEVRRALHDLKPETLAASGRTRRMWTLAAAGAAMLAVVVAAALWLRDGSARPGSFPMEKLTFDSGLAWMPTISADGRLVAYSSDRDGPFNIYVQQKNGLHAVRVTDNGADNWAPSFAPDGSKIAFRSDRDGGGIYVVDALGGAERRIAGEGTQPRFSPDGSTIAYLVSEPITRTAKMYLIDAAGGTPRPFQPDFAVTAWGPLHLAPVWSPDSHFLLFAGARLNDPHSGGWWIAQASGGAALPVKSPSTAPRRAFVRYLEAWHGQNLYYSEGTATASMSLYRVPLKPEPWRAIGLPEPVTAASGVHALASISAGGQLVFSSTAAAGTLHWLPLDGRRSIARGPPRRLPSDSTVKGGLAVAADGSRLAYVANLFGGDRTCEIRIRDLATGRDDVILCSGSTLPGLLRLSANGARLAYFDAPQGKALTYVTDARTTATHVFCENCLLHGFFSRTDEALVSYGNRLVRQNLTTGRQATLLQVTASKPWLYAMSPDDRRLAFTVTDPDGTARLWVAPVRTSGAPPNEWAQIDAGRYHLESPQWSGDGRTLYYGSNRDGFPCVWAQRMDTRGKPSGAPFAAYHWHDSGAWKMGGGVTFGITPERLYLMNWEVTGNIWSIDVGR